MSQSHRHYLKVFLSTAIIAGACANERSSFGPEDPATGAQVDDFCRSQCERVQTCTPELDPGADAGAPSSVTGCVSECRGSFGPLAANLQARFVQALADCFEALDCDETDDACGERALEAIGVDPEEVNESPQVRRCFDRQDDCQDTEGAFSDDLCGTIPVLIDSKRAEMNRCLRSECEDIPTCLGPIVGAIGTNED